MVGTRTRGNPGLNGAVWATPDNQETTPDFRQEFLKQWGSPWRCTRGALVEEYWFPSGKAQKRGRFSRSTKITEKIQKIAKIASPESPARNRVLLPFRFNTLWAPFPSAPPSRPRWRSRPRPPSWSGTAARR